MLILEWRVIPFFVYYCRFMHFSRWPPFSKPCIAEFWPPLITYVPLIKIPDKYHQIYFSRTAWSSVILQWQSSHGDSSVEWKRGIDWKVVQGGSAFPTKGFLLSFVSPHFHQRTWPSKQFSRIEAFSRGEEICCPAVGEKGEHNEKNPRRDKPTFDLKENQNSMTYVGRLPIQNSTSLHVPVDEEERSRLNHVENVIF